MGFFESLLKNVGKNAIVGGVVGCGGYLAYRHFYGRVGRSNCTTTPSLGSASRRGLTSFALVGASEDEDDLEPLVDAEARVRFLTHLRAFIDDAAARLDAEDAEKEQRLALERLMAAIKASTTAFARKLDEQADAEVLARLQADLRTYTTTRARELDALASLAPKKTTPVSSPKKTTPVSSPLAKTLPVEPCCRPASVLPCAENTCQPIDRLVNTVLDDLMAQEAALEDGGAVSADPEGDVATASSTASSSEIAGVEEVYEMPSINVTAASSDSLRRCDSAASESSGATSGAATPLSAHASVVPGPFAADRPKVQDRPLSRLGRGLNVAAAEFKPLAAPAPPAAAEPAEAPAAPIADSNLSWQAPTFVPTVIRKPNGTRRRGKKGTSKDMLPAVMRAIVMADKEQKASQA